MPDPAPDRSTTARSRAPAALAVLLPALAGWGALLWLVIDMGHPLAQLTMPPTLAWSAEHVAAVLAMWAVMMAAMMLPSALPMVLVFHQVSVRSGEPARSRAFVAGYLAMWAGFSLAATLAQWLLQALGWIDPMLASTSVPLTATLLLVAGAYQFSPLKRACLARCRSPLAFLVGEWRPGRAGAWRMGLRHGWLCTGCCWALMALLFVGGAMNLAWVAALAIAVAVEKLAPQGGRIAAGLGAALLAAGAVKLGVLLAA